MFIDRWTLIQDTNKIRLVQKCFLVYLGWIQETFQKQLHGWWAMCLFGWKVVQNIPCSLCEEACMPYTWGEAWNFPRLKRMLKFQITLENKELGFIMPINLIFLIIILRALMPSFFTPFKGPRK
jgi:hypothetical protein